MESAGIERRATFAEVSVSPGAKPVPPIVQVQPAARYEEVAHFLQGKPEANVHLYTEGWTALTQTQARVRLLLGTGAIAVFRSVTGITGLRIATSRVPRPVLKPGYLTGVPTA